MAKISYCEENEKKSKSFLKKFYNFTDDNFRLVITWRTREIQTLFPVKEKNLHLSCKICYGICDSSKIMVVKLSEILKQDVWNIAT